MQSDPRVRLTCKHSIGKSLGAEVKTTDILGPLLNDNGVIFPYTPMINASYVSNYGTHQPTHSNFVYKFFQNHSMQEITCSAEFTAATTAEAKYAVAALHFFKSAMKMGFGENDKNRGVPPPVLNFSGYGPGFFKNIPVVISNLNYALDTSTDYVFARIENAHGQIKGGNPIVDQTFIPIKVTFILSLSPAYNTYETRKQFTMKDFVNGKLLGKGFS
jgi:hypothetical protein